MDQIKENWRQHAQPTTEEQINISTDFFLIDFPHIVGEIICKHLNRSSLLTLRLVCHKTKSWVESPSVLKRIPIEIKNTKIFYTVLTESEVPWSNFSISSCLPQLPLAEDFTWAYGLQMKALNFQSLANTQRVLDIVLECPTLEILIINDLNLRQLTTRQLTQLEKNFESLKRLEINVLGEASEDDVEIFMRLVTSSLNLNFLKFPYLHWEADPFVIHEAEDALDRTRIWRTKIILPIINYIKERSSIGRGKGLAYLDIGYVYELESTSFQELVECCYRSGTKLLNVMHVNLLNISPREYTNDVNPFSTIDSLNISDLRTDLSLLTNLRKLYWTISPKVGRGIDPRDLPELEMPKLETLHMSVFPVEEDNVADVVNKLFINAKRPTVTNLKLCWNMVTELGFIRAVDLCRNFPNLRTLEFFKWQGDDEQFMIVFQGIPFLQNLIVKDCRYLTDKAFVGVDRNTPSPFIKLQNLQRLWIRSYAQGITDESFQYAFWKLPIRHLNFHCIGSPTVTSKGLSALSKQPFLNSIEYITIDRPFGIPEKLIRTLKFEFKNLKKFSY